MKIEDFDEVKKLRDELAKATSRLDRFSGLLHASGKPDAPTVEVIVDRYGICVDAVIPVVTIRHSLQQARAEIVARLHGLGVEVR